MTSQEPDPIDAALLERYRQASRAEGLEPAEAVRAAILAEGRRVAEQRAAAPLRSFDTSQPAANQPRWRIAALGTFGVAVLAALLIVPRWLIPAASPPQVAAIRSAPAPEAPAPMVNAPTAAAPPPAALAKSEAPSREGARHDQRAAPSSKSSGTQFAEVAPAASGGIPRAADSSTAAQANSVAGARAAQDRSYSPAAPPRQAALSSPTSLMTAVMARDLGRATILLDQHVSTEDRDDLGRTPLMVATVQGQVEIVQLLLARGADPNVADNTGSTPLQQAHRSHFTQIAQMLEQAGAH
jgi:hypothetical protein